MASSLGLFHPAVQRWFRHSLGEPTEAQKSGWPAIEQGYHTLICAPTGSGKTLAAFLFAMNRLLFSPPAPKKQRCRVLYISPLKALAVDVEKNLQSPIAGIVAMAGVMQAPNVPSIAMRTGDTSSRERSHFLRNPSDILITTPESLYLLLTSAAGENLTSVETVIVDEIHTMVGTKRGAHLAISLERLQQLTTRPFQRIGLSATINPLEQAAKFLGGFHKGQPRPVTVVHVKSPKRLDLEVIAAVEDMSRLGEVFTDVPPSSTNPTRLSIWPAIHANILHLIRTHRTTLIFANNRRLAERLAAAINELAETEIAKAHHGSVAREQRMQIEEDLKTGRIPAIVATSSLELGIDMGSIDLVIQVEAPPGVAAALQRIGRAGHHIDAASKGVLFPKYRGDLVACAALTNEMLQGNTEKTSFLRNPLDVVAQQIVAMTSMRAWNIDELEETIRSAAPFHTLTRRMLENVLDMLSGRYPSDQFNELRPRITWDRISGKLEAREGAKRVAIINGGTIPDRGLFHVSLAGAEPSKARVGELDEEMVYETRIGETFLLGTSSWRVEEITHDRVLVSPAPGQAGKMPFWKGEGAGRALEFGRAVGALLRELSGANENEASLRLMNQHKLNDWATNNLLQYLHQQKEKTGIIPDDKTIVVERYLDDFGDWRVCILSTFGARVHAPWTHAIEAMIRQKWDFHAETLWSDDGIVVRFPEMDEPPPVDFLLPEPEQAERLVVDHLGSSPLFASRFREAAARALLLPRRYPGQRTPLWQQRKRAFDLLQVAAKFPDFPILLEAYREVLQDVFDMEGFLEILKGIRSKNIQVSTVNTTSPSPFAASLMFNYVGSFIYEGDAPLAERKAQALAIDALQLRELLGEPEIKELIDPEVTQEIELQLQHLHPEYRIHTRDSLHDLLLRIGDLTQQEIYARSAESSNTVDGWLQELSDARRIVPVELQGEQRWIASEDAGRYSKGTGATIEPDLPEVFLAAPADATGDLISRYARTHGSFTAREIAQRFGMIFDTVLAVIRTLEEQNRVIRLAPGHIGELQEWSDATVFRRVRQKSLARLRREVEPVEPAVFARFLPEWHGLNRKRVGSDALLDVIAQIQGYPVPASVLETQILPARMEEYEPADLDAVMSAGLVLWSGVESLGNRDGRIALYLAENAAQLLRSPENKNAAGDLHHQIREYLEQSGASFFAQIQRATGHFKQEVLTALWDLVWAGEITNDTLMPLRSLLRSKNRTKRKHHLGIPSRSGVPLEATGRWSLLSKIVGKSTPTQHLAATAQQLLKRFGVVTREVIGAEKIAGGFSAIYPVLKTMEETGKIRRGYFIAGRGAAQFALPGALDRLRAIRDTGAEPNYWLLAATDPANPYGAALPWPQHHTNFVPGRTAGARVVLVKGELVAFLSKGQHSLYTFLPKEDAAGIDAIAAAVAGLVESGKRRAVYLTDVDGVPPGDSVIRDALLRHGFTPYPGGWQKKKLE